MRKEHQTQLGLIHQRLFQNPLPFAFSSLVVPTPALGMGELLRRPRNRTEIIHDLARSTRQYVRRNLKRQSGATADEMTGCPVPSLL